MKFRRFRKELLVFFSLLLMFQATVPSVWGAEAGVGITQFALTDSLPVWAKAEIEELLDKGIIEQAAEVDSFVPNGFLTRADAAVWLLHLVEQTSLENHMSEGSVFSDISNNLHRDEIVKAAGLGLIEGYSNGTFLPDASISRTEIAVMLQRVLELDTSEGSSFEDQSLIPAWGALAVGAMSKAGIVNGYEDQTYRPYNQVTRAEAAVMLHRAWKLVKGKPVVSPDLQEGTLQLTVRAPDGSQLQGAAVQIHVKGKRGYIAEGLTNAAGRYEAKLPYGTYDVNVMNKDTVAYQVVEFNKPNMTSNVQMTQAAIITGKIVGRHNKPEPGVIVTFTTNPTFYAITEIDGMFRAAVLPDRKYELSMLVFDDWKQLAEEEEAVGGILYKAQQQGLLKILDADGNGDQTNCSCQLVDVKETIQSAGPGKTIHVGSFSALDGSISDSGSSQEGGGGGGSQGGGNPVDKTAPAVPAGLTASVGDRSAALSWSSVADKDLAGYKVYMSTDEGGTWSILAAAVTKPSYEASALTNDTTYSFAVTSYDTAGNESVKSTPVTVQPGLQVPPAPQGFNGTTGDGEVALTWLPNTDDDTEGYLIITTSADDQGASYDEERDVGTQTDYRWTGLTNGQPYQFELKAYNANHQPSTGVTLNLTPAASVETDITPPAIPAGLTAAPGDTKVQLTWNANDDEDLSGYHVYVSSDGGATWGSGISSGLAAGYQVTGLTNAKAYTFAVTASDSSGNESSKSTKVSATPVSGTQSTTLAVPTGLVGSAVDGSSSLMWSANQESELSGYKVYTSSDQGLTWNAGADARKLNAYTVSGLTDGVNYSFAVTAYDQEGNETFKSNPISLTPLKQAVPSDPAVAVPPLPMTGQPTFGEQTQFLYSGSNPVQVGVIPDAIRPALSAVLSGHVLDAQSQPLSGAKVTILNHPEFGQTLSRGDGAFDMVVNGTGTLTVQFSMEGYLLVQRPVKVTLGDYTQMEDVVLRAYDSKVTELNLLDSDVMQVAQGTPVSDEDGTRTSTLVVPKGTSATMTLSDGTVQVLPEIHFRSTEYTVGSNGLEAMPGVLPQNVGYTYAVELSADEAIAAGASEVTFNQPVYHYVDNFLNFPVGSSVPNAYYDRKAAVWVPAQNGIIIQILGTEGGSAQIDTDGDHVADDSLKLGKYHISDEELQKLAVLYTAGQSLWRVPIPHFTPYDHNWPYGPPPDAKSPPKWAPKNTQPDPREEPCKQQGSIIGCQDQSLGEAISIPGTPYMLRYQSERTEGYKERSTIQIPITGSEPLPSSLKGISIVIEVAGKVVHKALPKTLNQSYTFTWDGLDGYGRKLLGDHSYHASVRYHYNLVYYPAPSDFQSSWAQVSSSNVTIGSRDNTEMSLNQDYSGLISSPINPYGEMGVAGWSLNRHHFFDKTTSKLLTGDGEALTKASGQYNPLFANAQGLQQQQYSVHPTLIATVGFDQYFVVKDSSVSDEISIIRISPDHVSLKVAAYPSTGSFPAAFTVSPDGTIFLSFSFSGVYKKGPADSDWKLVIGAGAYLSPPIPDGIRGVDATIGEAKDFAADGEGNLYFMGIHKDPKYPSNTIVEYYKLDANGYVYRTGINTYGASPDSGPATASNVGSGRIVVSPNGTLYVLDVLSDYGAIISRIRKVTKDGTLELVAGGKGKRSIAAGRLATNSAFLTRNIFIDGQENVYFEVDVYNSSYDTIYRIAPDGIVHVVDNIDAVNYLKQNDTMVNNLVLVGVDQGGGMSFRTYDPQGKEPQVFRQGVDHRKTVIPNDDGVTLTVTDSQTGRHVETKHALTGHVLESFGYDEEGRLIQITDGYGNMTTIERDEHGKPLSITAPGGQRTELNVDENNQLRTVRGKLDFRFDMTYTDTGLLSTFTNPNLQTSEYQYDDKGLLVQAKTPTGGIKTLVRTELQDGMSITFTDAANRQTVYETRKVDGNMVKTITEPGGAKSTVTLKSDGSKEMIYVDGTKVTQMLGSDPRYGMDAPVLNQMKVTTVDGRSISYTETRSVEKDAQGGLKSLTHTYVTNGATSTVKYDAEAGAYIETTAEGAVKVSHLDEKGRIILEEYPNQPIASISYTFDERGRFKTMKQSDHSMTYAYNADDQLISETDESGSKKEYGYNEAGLLTSIKLPSGKTYYKDYDANGNPVQTTMPDGTIYNQHYNSLNQFNGFQQDGHNPWITLTHNDAGFVDHATLASGRSLQYGFESGGSKRIQNMSDPDLQRSFMYADATDRVTQMVSNQTLQPSLQQTVGYKYIGSEVLQIKLQGAANATFDYTYDTANITNITNVRTTITEQATNVVHNTEIGWDRDEQMTKFGPFEFERELSGLVGSISDSRFKIKNHYDELGKLQKRDYMWDGQLRSSSQYMYDSRGLLSDEIQTAAEGGANQVHYEYDQDGQLLSATRSGDDGAYNESYEYGANKNRLSRQVNQSVTEMSYYDSQGVLQSAGSVNYSFDEDGFLTSRGNDVFRYGIRGELLEATVVTDSVYAASTSSLYRYAYDAIGRRTMREDGSGNTEKYLYGHPEFIHMMTASIDKNGVFTSYYYNDEGLLIGFERDNQRYYVVTDNVGTPREIMDASGSTIKTLRYDSFGSLLSDSNPELGLLIGFAGGLEDRDIGLVRFGARDYDPVSGRWTARDPILLDSGESNIYAYVGNNPVALRDPCGLFCVGISAYAGVGIGGKVCVTEEGVSGCYEAGLGAGGGLEINPFEDLSKGGSSVEAAAKAQYGPLKADLGGKYFKAWDPCKEGEGSLIAKLGAGPYQLDLNDLSKSAVKGKMGDLQKNLKELFKPSYKLEAAAKVKQCLQYKW